MSRRRRYSGQKGRPVGSSYQLLNRRECIPADRSLHKDRGRDGALILIDIDNFKSINDTNGHLFGDKVLVDLAAALRLAFRRNDITARIGGDEFIAFMPHIHVRGDVVPKLETILYSLSRCAETDGRQMLHRSQTARLPSASGSAFILIMEGIFPPSMKRLTQPCTTPNEEVKTNITYIRKMHWRHKIPDLPGIKLMGAPKKG